MNKVTPGPSNGRLNLPAVFMKTFSAALLVTFFALPAWATPVDLGTVKLRDGRELQNVKVIKVEPDGLRLEHRDGVGKVRMEELPGGLSQQFSLNEDTAAAWRQAEKKRLDYETDRRHRAQVSALVEASRASQETQARATRMSIFDQTRTGQANYAAVDDQLLTQIQLWKEAGREDLAARFEEDRQVLKQQEIARPAAASESEKQALARRVDSLQTEVEAANRRPTTTTVLVDSDRTSLRSGYNPYYSSYYTSPGYYGPSPVIVTPPYCPPVGYPTPVHPGTAHRPVPLVQPAPRPMNMGNPIFGSHLYQK